MFSSSSLTPTPPCPLPPPPSSSPPVIFSYLSRPRCIISPPTFSLCRCGLRIPSCAAFCAAFPTRVPPASRHPRLPSSSPPPRHFLPVTHFYKDEWVQKREKKREDAGQSNTSSHSPSLSRSLFPVETHWLSIIISACSDFQRALSCFFCSFLNLLVCMRV